MKQLTVADLLKADDSDLEPEVYLLMLAYEVGEHEVEDWSFPELAEKVNEIAGDAPPIEDGIWTLGDGRQIPVREPKGMEILRAVKAGANSAAVDVELAAQVSGMLPDTIKGLSVVDFAPMRKYLLPFAGGATRARFA